MVFLNTLRNHIRYRKDSFAPWKIPNPVIIDRKTDRLYIDLEREDFSIELSCEIIDYSKDFNTVNVTFRSNIHVWYSGVSINLARGASVQEGVKKSDLLNQILETFKQTVDFIEYTCPDYVFQGDITDITIPDFKTGLNFYIPSNLEMQRGALKDSVGGVTKAFEAASLTDIEIDTYFVASTLPVLAGRGRFKLPDDSEWDFTTHIEFSPGLKVPIAARITTTTVRLGDHFQQDVWTNKKQEMVIFDKDAIISLVQDELDKVMEAIRQDVSGIENDL